MSVNIKQYTNDNAGIIEVVLDYGEYENITIKVCNMFEQFNISAADIIITFSEDETYRFYKHHFDKIQNITKEMLLNSILESIQTIVDAKLTDGVLKEEE